MLPVRNDHQLNGKNVSAVIGCSVFKKKMVRPRPQTSVTLLWPNPCWSFATKYISQLVPHQEQELAMRPFFIIVFFVLKRQWRRGACRRNYNTASARLKQNSALSLHTRTHRKSEKPPFDCGHPLSKSGEPLSKTSELHTKQRGTDELKEGPHSETSTNCSHCHKNRRVQTSQLNSKGFVAHVPSSFLF